MPRYCINASLLGEKPGIERLSSHFRLLYQGLGLEGPLEGPFEEKNYPYNHLWVVVVVVVQGLVTVMVVAY